MTKAILTLALAGLITAIVLCTTSAAEVHQTLAKTYTMENPPLDVTGSVDGKYTFVLTEGGKVVIFSQKGEQFEIAVDATMDQIFTSGRADRIFLSSKKTKQVQEVLIDFTQHIDISGSPFLGNKEAQITLVAFSDFQ